MLLTKDKLQIHGNGFAIIPLDETGQIRMHIWDHRLPRQVVDTGIHNHSFGFKSWVLQGTMVNVCLDVAVDRVTHNLYTPSDHGPLENNVLIPTGMQVRFRPYRTDIVDSGQSYDMPAAMFHLSFYVGTMVTVIKKVNKLDSRFQVAVACPIGQEPDNDFDRKGGPDGWTIPYWLNDLYLTYIMEAYKVSENV
jgi:hypothetical protein